MEIEYKNYNYKNNKLNIKFKKNKIIGIHSNSVNEIIEIFNIIKKEKNIFINNEKITEENILIYQNKMPIIKNINYEQIEETIKDYFLNIIVSNNIYVKDEVKKINDSLKMLNLKNIDINRKINTLSTSEKTLLTISLLLIHNPEIIILQTPFLGLDINNIKQVKLLFNKLVDNYNKTIILIDNNPDIIHKNTNYLYLIKDNKLFIEGKTKEVYKKYKLLEDNNFILPNSVKFISKVNDQKNIKLDYLQDIRDIIKDIYKHV